MGQKFWYVIATDSHDADDVIEAWGEFDNEIDARAFALDLANDNGWEGVEPVYDTPHEIASKTTEYQIHNPYHQNP